MSNNTPTLYYLVGIPASGKSTYAHQLAKKNENTVVMSSDAIREELYGDESIQGDSQEVFKILHERVKENLKNGVNVVYDATNVKSKRRRAFVESLNKIDCYKQCIIVVTPYEECLERNKNRDRVVPEYAIERMYKQWDTPWYFEGWDDIDIFYGDFKKFKDPFGFVDNYKNYSQDNPHHELTLGEHCLAVSNSLRDNYDDDWLVIAGLLHDCGKPFTKSFKNSKDEITDIAHYYSHEHVGAYETLFYDPISPDYISVLINLHMYPYIWEKNNNEKMRLKYKKLWGDVLYNDIMKLHEADKAAH